MLACRKCLVVYSELTSDAYAAWPVYAEVKNQQIWSHILDPVLDNIVDLPILWAETAHGFSYVKVNEASFIDHEESPPPIVTRKLVNLGFKVVHLPKKVLETILSNDKLKGIVNDLYINPHMVREALKSKKGLLCSDEEEEIYDLLRYLFRGKPSLDSLRDLEVLPLKAISEFATINGKQVFLFSQRNIDALEFLPGISSSTIDANIPPDLQIVLEELAGQGQSSLTLVTKEIVCSHLLPSSMKSWYPNLDVERKCLWEPGVSHHPPLEWIHDIWLWIQTHNAVDYICNIPLVPTEIVSDSTNKVMLLPLNTSPELCTLPSEKLPCSQNEILSIIRKMGLIHIPKSDCVFRCPGTIKYIKHIDAHFLLKHVRKLQSLSLTDSDRDCLLEYLSCDLLSSTLTQEEVDNIKSLPIFKAGVGGSPSCYVSLNKAQYILPPHGLQFKNGIKYPSNILCDDNGRVTALLENLQITRIVSVDEFCQKVILPHIPHNIQLSDNDECLIMWVLQCPLSRPAFLNDFSIIKPCVGDVPRKPSELYDPQENIFLTLYDREKDPVFPDSKYDSVLHVLRQAGLINWAHISSKHNKMVALFTERMQSLSSLSKSKALEISKHLLHLLVAQGILEHFRDTQFLFPQETPPDGYPLSLEWCGKDYQRPLCPQELCATESESFVVGSVVPVVSREYRIHDRSAEFHQVSSEEIVQHFKKVVLCKPNSEKDWANVHDVIMKVYYSLISASSVCNLPDAWIWWRSQKLFLRPDQCIFSLPPDIGSLEPYLFNISVNPGMLMCVKALLPKLNAKIQGSLTCEIAIAVLKQMEQVKGKELTNEDIQMSLHILNWIKSSGAPIYCDVLIPTSLKTLASVSECTYDDRNWNTKVQKSKYTFVHEDVSSALAKHFNVVPLSRKVAPSRNLKLKYTKTGQREPVTRRIKQIVDDYATSTDILKELLQNADDAKATEVKFLIDWRHHPTSSLFTEELACWQGPALIAYNNAVFSDQDFEHICELAGETKMKDPLKIGRFGVGFCATYQLTDIPSFISRRFFTMFDPHTSYLGDRVSAGEPGMRIDLVENTEDLSLYEDQFMPYNGLFGCNVFDLSGDGFQGTLFRFPFRSYKTANRSNISQEIIDTYSVKQLIEAFINQASHLLLFLKHIRKVSLFFLNRGEKDVKNMEQKAYISKECDCVSNCDRLNLLNHRGHDLAMTSCYTTIMQQREKGTKITSRWIVCSAVSPSIKHIKERGLVPIAEVAFQVHETKPGEVFPLTVDGLVFCFLPLPKKTSLPFHINGLFEISRDRSGLKSVDDGRFGKKWNNDLCEDPLMHAYTLALSEIARRSPKLNEVDAEDKKKYLKQYYHLFKLSKKEEFSSLCSSVKENLFKSEAKLVWSDVGGGKWLRLRDAVILHFTQAKHMTAHATNVMLELNYNICELPHHVEKLFIESSRKSHLRQVYTCESFYENIFLPNVKVIKCSIRDIHIIFLLKNLEEIGWIWSLLKNKEFVPVKSSMSLKSPSILIDERKILMADLYDKEEERFPEQCLQDSDQVMKSLKLLGMPGELSINEIKGRAERVVTITDSEIAVEQSWKLIKYLQKQYSPYYRIVSVRHKELTDALGNVPFIPVAIKPPDCNLPWHGCQALVEPCKIFTPKWNNVVFSAFPVVVHPESHELKSDILLLIGASPEPPLDLVVSHLINLSKASNSFNEKAMSFMAKVADEVYAFLNSKILYFRQEELSKVKGMLEGTAFIWQSNRFHRADQIVLKWTKGHYPYLCELSSENMKYRHLFVQLGVQEQPSANHLAIILSQITENAKKGGTESKSIDSKSYEDDEDPNPVSDEVIDFIEIVVKRLSELCESDEISEDLYLPDEYCVMRQVNSLACDKVSKGKEDWIRSLDMFASQFEDSKFHFIHPSIPRERAITLGVKPLLDALVKGLEDEEFMAGIDYGQHEDLCDRLKSILSKYPADHSILNEFLQNADDARATEIVFILDHRKFSKEKLFPSRHQRWKDLQETPALLVVNNSKFTEEDIKGIAKLGRGGKQNASDTIGRFGIGFNVAYHVTDCPSFVTFSEEGEPQNFCVFDPTCRFANTTSNTPGKRWRINSKTVVDLPGQFQPYLLRNVSIPLLQNLEHEHVVFRLPLTRNNLTLECAGTTPYRHRSVHQSSVTYTTQEKHISRKVFSASAISKLFMNMEYYVRDTLLFLNHLQKISAVEIEADGHVHKYFSTAITMSHEAKTMCTKFAESVKDITKGASVPKVFPIVYKTKVVHKKATASSEQIEEDRDWLVCKRYSPITHVMDEKSEICNMRPIGGVAAALDTTDIKGRLFCFLPMPLESKFPVHVNGHFLVDDSRKHLEKMPNDIMLNWNVLLSKKVIAPCYVELLMHALQMAQKEEVQENWFYKLFPSIGVGGEVGNLKLPESVYSLLYEENPDILLQKNPETGSVKWLTLRGHNMGYFLQPFISEKTNQLVETDPELHTALVKLGMPVTTKVPHMIHDNFRSAVSKYEAYVSSELILYHMMNSAVTKEMEAVLTVKVLRLVLEFMKSSMDIPNLKKALRTAPLLLSSDNNLWKGEIIFKSRHASLLPHCSAAFVLHEIEQSDIGMFLAEPKCGVIVELPVKYVQSNIDLSDTQQPIKINDIPSEKIELIKRLWEYIQHTHILSLINTKDFIKENFPLKPLLPADDGYLYPSILSSTILCSKTKNSDMKNALIKLKYPCICFELIKMTEPYGTHLGNQCADGDDIISCFKLRSPPFEDANLTSDEVRCIIESVRGQAELQQITAELKRLKIFKTVGRGFMSMKRNPNVFVMPHDVPKGGIHIIQQCCEAECVILDAADEFTMKFYSIILQNIDCDKVKFYRKVILPHICNLSVDDIQDHLRHISCNKLLKRNLLEDLRKTKLIQLPNGHYHEVRELCHANSIFYITFCGDRLLPNPWNTELYEWLPFFKELGFRHEVSVKEWIHHCKLFAIHSSNELGVDTIINKSEALLDTLLDMFKTQKFSYSMIPEISSIKFIFNNDPEPAAILHEVGMLFDAPKMVQKNLFCFSGSIFNSTNHLAALCRPILPSSCDFLEREHAMICKCLKIESPVKPQTIISNLKMLSSMYTCIKKSTCPHGAENLRKMLVKHFTELNKCCHHRGIDFSDLKDTLCVAVSTTQCFQPLVLVKPSQLIKMIPSDIHLEPFFYQVPPDIAHCEHFLAAVGVPQDLSVYHCLDVLHGIFCQLQEINRSLSSSSKFKEIALNAYKHLVCMLRKGKCGELPKDIFLPTEDDELIPLNELLFNDAPWYSDRLPRGEMFRFLKLPPPDTNGEKIPPDSLGVKRLTSVVSEALHEDMKSDDWACNHELCYAKDKSKRRCKAVQNILETLQSKGLKDGLLRVYYSERRERPSQQFEEILQRLNKVEITCVTFPGILTVLKKDSAVIEGSESTNKHCLALINTEIDILVIAPHDKNCGEVEFIQNLSKAVNSILQNEIKNEAYLTTMLMCAPTDIEEELNKQQVVRYDPNSIKETKYLQAGEVIPLNSLILADCLLIINFNIGEVVHYYDQKRKTLVAARVVHIRQSEIYENTIVTLSLKETKTPDEQDYEKKSMVNVSPACIFKTLTPAQQIILFSKNSDNSQVKATAEPVIFVPVSCEPNHINTFLKSSFFKGIPKDMAVLRLIVQIHYLKVQSNLLSKKFAPFLLKLQDFLQALDPSQPLAKYILEIANNNLKISMPISSSITEGHTTLPTHLSLGASVSHGNIPTCISVGGVSSLTSPGPGSLACVPHPLQTRAVSNVTSTIPSSVGYGSATNPLRNIALPHINQPSTTSNPVLSRFQPHQRRTGQQSYRRPQRYRFLDQEQPIPPPQPKTSERHAQIWLDQAKMDYRAALFLMGFTNLTPVVVPAPAMCMATSSVPELDVGDGDASKPLTEEIPCLESHSSESLISSLNDQDNNEDVIVSSDQESSDLYAATVSEPSQGKSVPKEGATPLESNSSISIISSLNSEHREGSDKTPQFPSVVCFLCHDAVEKLLKGVMYAYCGLNSELINCSALVTLFQQIKVSRHFPQNLLKPIEKCVMQINEHQKRSRYPNFQIPPCAPAVAYTAAIANEALMSTKDLFYILMRDEKIAPLLKGIEELPIPQFTSMLLSLGGNDGKQLM